MNAKRLLCFLPPFLFAILMQLVAFFTLTHAAVAPTGDHQALLAIKSMIKVDPQGVMTSWNHSVTNFCQWQGVTCGSRHHRVIILDLSSSGLIGTLSPSVGNLSFLRVFVLSKNSFSGEIPPEIGRLFRLQELRLHNNSFTGNIPATIMNCSNLQVLDLDHNNLVGKIPDRIGSLSMLNNLFLSLNNLTGTIPPSFYNCSSLVQVFLDHNQLKGRLHENLGLKLPRLQVLSLSQNHFQGIFLDIPRTLFDLNLRSNNFGGKLPSPSNGSSPTYLALSDNFFEGSLHKLVCSNGMNMTRVLDLGNNRLSGVIPDCWDKWSSLNYLALWNNNLSGEFPITLGNITSLEALDMWGNMFGGNLTKSFWRLPPNLTYLVVSENQFQGMLRFSDIPVTLKVFDLSSNNFWGSLHSLLCSNGTKEIELLDLGNNHFSGVIPECWDRWPSLVYLNLENNNFSGEIPRTLGYIPSLKLLNMHGNNISGKLPSSLMNLSNLKILQLGRNELVGSIPTWIGTTLTFLKILNLRSNHFHGNIPHQLCHLSHAHILDLAHNNLSGNIPRCFNNFSVLSGKEPNLEVQFSFSFYSGKFIVSDLLVMKGREDTYEDFLGLVMILDLSSNNFSGQIPSELTALHELKSLNLSRNQLTGKIPDQIGEMKSLESLDLSVNKLSKELPMSLSRLNFLSSFNVSYNNLIGKVPTSTQFQSFNESSFLGNRLCGPPLTNGCVPVKEGDTIKDSKENDGSRGEDWVLALSIVVGFVIGFWIIVAPLTANTSWKIAYFRLMRKLIKDI